MKHIKLFEEEKFDIKSDIKDILIEVSDKYFLKIYNNYIEIECGFNNSIIIHDYTHDFYRLEEYLNSLNYEIKIEVKGYSLITIGSFGKPESRNRSYNSFKDLLSKVSKNRSWHRIYKKWLENGLLEGSTRIEKIIIKFNKKEK